MTQDGREKQIIEAWQSNSQTDTHICYDSSGRVISPLQTLLTTVTRDIHYLEGIRTRSLNKRATADPRLSN